MPVGLHPNTSGLGTIETHVPTVWEYLWHFGGRPKCFFLKRSALILRKHMSIIRKRIAHMFHAQGPSAKMVTGQVRNLTSRLPRARGYSAIYIAMRISPRRSDRTGNAVKLAAANRGKLPRLCQDIRHQHHQDHFFDHHSGRVGLSPNWPQEPAKGWT